MVWMLECVIKVFKPEAGIFPNSLHKILFMVQSEEYWRTDGMYYLFAHSSETKGLCLMKWPSEMLKNFLYFWNMKTHEVFSFFTTLFFSLMNALDYGKFWSILLYHFIKHKRVPLFFYTLENALPYVNWKCYTFF